MRKERVTDVPGVAILSELGVVESRVLHDAGEDGLQVVDSGLLACIGTVGVGLLAGGLVERVEKQLEGLLRLVVVGLEHPYDEVHEVAVVDLERADLVGSGLA